jgi:hypothetical protein
MHGITTINNASKQKTDNDIRDYLMSTHHLRDTTDVALYSRDRQADIIHATKDYGASIRQLSRLTGISIGIIRNM